MSSRLGLFGIALGHCTKDASGKLIEEESKSDSGFISSGSIIVSGEISGELQPETSHGKTTSTYADSGVIDDNDTKDAAHMRVDSGVYLTLSENISNLSLKSHGLNDLNNPKETTAVSKEYLHDIPWKIYYEQDEDGDTHLHTAVVQGFVEVAQALIRIAPHSRLLDTPNDDAQTPLHLAVVTSQWPVVRWLIVAGARPGPRDINGDSPLHIAARLGDLDCVKAITNPVQPQEREALALGYPPHRYEKCSLNQWNYSGQTCVHVAAIHGHIDVLRHLVWYGADINAREGLSGYTALHYAVERRDEKMVQFLLTECNTLRPETVSYGNRNALQMKILIPGKIGRLLSGKGLASPYMSSDEEDSGSEDDEEMEFNTMHRLGPNLVNASA
ncbi:NF-kappa-B inhibitor cactus [Cylas formicarius]|uniref:NF-kappa-B inhibitor cactus n=1 Tax=Cylas formicarius TaxID=197179 RepID=UPI002958BC18|nr:NF-kappa-B inhibitor cactus [Cylas formicarius]